MLPPSFTVEQFKALDLRAPCFVSAAVDVLAQTNRTAATANFASNGSLPVVLLGSEFAIKFFPSVFADAFATEVKALRFLSELDVPKVLKTGRIDDWQYVLMTRLRGDNLKDLWPTLSREARSSACRDVGGGLRRIHDRTLTDSADASSWLQFISKQKDACVARHLKLGLRDDLLAQIPSFLANVDLTPRKICFLHTEVGKDHVFFDSAVDGLSFEGFIDFEPSMTGDCDYDFASVGIFLTSADRGAHRAFFEGYGDLDRANRIEFRRKIMAYTLLHRYSNLTWYLQFLPSASSLDELADLWWAV